MEIKKKLQQIANKSTNRFDFIPQAEEVLKINIDRNSMNYLIKKFGITTNFRRGRPERKFD